MAKKKKASNRAMPTAVGMDKKYQEEDDARTLARAHEIKSDKSRMKGAKAGATRMVDEETTRLQGLKAVARKKI